MVIQQVDLINVQQAAVGGCQHTGFKVAFALFDGAFNIQRADDAVFGGADRQVNERYFAGFNLQAVALRVAFFGPVGPGVSLIGVIVERGFGKDLDLWQQSGHGARRGRFSCATLAAD